MPKRPPVVNMCFWASALSCATTSEQMLLVKTTSFFLLIKTIFERLTLIFSYAQHYCEHMYKVLTGDLLKLTFSKTKTLQIFNELRIVWMRSLRTICKLLECFPALRPHRSLTQVCQMPGLVLLFGLQIAGRHVFFFFLINTTIHGTNNKVSDWDRGI